MMKKAILFFVFLFSSLILFAESFGSNVLGQVISTNTDGFVFVIETSEDKDVLYENGVPVLERQYTNHASIKTITETDLKTGKSEFSVYDNSLLQRFEVIKNGKTEETSYIYENGSLSFSIYSENGEVQYIEYYLRSASDNSLVGVKRYGKLHVYSDEYVLNYSKVFYSAGETLMTQDSFTVNEEGNITVNKNDGLYTYTPSGLLISIQTENSLTENKYNEYGALCETSLTEGENKTTSYYSDNVVTKAVSYINGVISTELIYNNPDYALVKNVYLDGSLKATAYYTENTVSASRIEYNGVNR